ncbi:MAG: glycogen synthase [Culicoidibacterales bacterium]
MKVLYVTAECYPFLKTGGLADVAFALPQELKHHAMDIRVIMPKYGKIAQQYKAQMKHLFHFYVHFGENRQYCGIDYLNYEGVDYYFVDNEYYFNRDGAYGFTDDCERFAFFNKAVLDCLYGIDFWPEVLHLNDWHTGMIGPLLDAFYRQDYRYHTMRTIITIHNLQHQGVFGFDNVKRHYGIELNTELAGKCCWNGDLNHLKAAIECASVVSTVSPTYAHEIQTPAYGEGLDGFLRYHAHKLVGILNGLNTKIYNPETDQALVENYSLATSNQKMVNKMALQQEACVSVDPTKPIFGMVTRLSDQKGLDLVMGAIGHLIFRGCQLIILGTGEAHYERMLAEWANTHSENVAISLQFDEKYARRIYAGSDFFLMPSRFEPCGLSQLIAMRYGALPVVRLTGGLVDTVNALHYGADYATGFGFEHYDLAGLTYVIDQAADIYYNQQGLFAHMQQNAMQENFSWHTIAQRYRVLYDRF